MTEELSAAYLAWNRFHRQRHRVVAASREPADLAALSHSLGTLLPRAHGHSYGDSCLNADNALLDTRDLNRILSFDRDSGVIRCEAGVSMGAIQSLATDRGWRLAVSPSTQHVSVGGAVAHDVHGRNHVVAGSFGQYVSALDLLRTDGSRQTCSATENADLFRASVGGMGLTGLITAVDIQLRRTATSYIEAETIGFSDLVSFMERFEQSAHTHEYATAWLDLMTGRPFAGILELGNEASEEQTHALPTTASAGRTLRVPFDLPRHLMNRTTVRAFNRFYYGRSAGRPPGLVHFTKYFYQLDAVDDWNRVLGRRGFLQYHFVIPTQHVAAGLPRLIELVRRSGNVCFLAILKRYGSGTFPGLMSFPVQGLGGAFDFVNLGQRTIDLFHALDELLVELEGKVYLAKDSLLTPDCFAVMYPRWKEFSDFIDPRFSSSLWRRVTRDQ
ncbi:FAD-binding oxidoreductase [Angustibacter sp. McL0619]|uniref:FAD-binding oxidoreductase n=1 Tax=Angustibacter sp. McL0619 TaxID=3415676 RepID=UPI003CF6B1F5